MFLASHGSLISRKAQRPKPSDLLTGIGSSETTIPQELTLHQNYPNPFNPSTAISYQLSASSFVCLKVFNTLGKEVATLVNEVRSAGNHVVQWNAGLLPSGIYFCRLQAGGNIETRKMILLR